MRLENHPTRDSGISHRSLTNGALVEMIRAQHRRQRRLNLALTASAVAWLLVVTVGMARPATVPDEITAKTFRPHLAT